MSVSDRLLDRQHYRDGDVVLYLRLWVASWLSNTVFTSHENIAPHCCEAWDNLIDEPGKIMSIGLRYWAHGYCSMRVGISASSPVTGETVGLVYRTALWQASAGRGRGPGRGERPSPRLRPQSGIEG